MECRLFRIEGRVQGVWFRESTRREAEPLGITGYARNLADGSVEVLACGEPDALDRLAQWLQNGPPLARVTRVEWGLTERERPAAFVTR
jgi:acylphosphatase